MRIVALMKNNPVLQGQNSEQQYKQFVPEIHLLATLKVWCRGEPRQFKEIVSKPWCGEREYFKLC
jgi:hypothetical protein